MPSPAIRRLPQEELRGNSPTVEPLQRPRRYSRSSGALAIHYRPFLSRQHPPRTPTRRQALLPRSPPPAVCLNLAAKPHVATVARLSFAPTLTTFLSIHRPASHNLCYMPSCLSRIRTIKIRSSWSMLPKLRTADNDVL